MFLLEGYAALLAHFCRQDGPQLGRPVSGVQPPLGVIVELEPHRAAGNQARRHKEAGRGWVRGLNALKRRNEHTVLDNKMLRFLRHDRYFRGS